MSKSKSHPCKHPLTARRELKGIPPAFRCVKCGKTVTYKAQPDEEWEGSIVGAAASGCSGDWDK